MTLGDSRYSRTVLPLWPRPMYCFLALQAADLMSTLIFRSMGVAETNPMAAYLMDHFGSLSGLLILKCAAIAVGLSCDIASHPVFLRRINAIYCGIIAINYLTICNTLRS